METLSRSVILDGAFNPTTCSREILFVVHSNIWLRRWFKIKTTITHLIFGHSAFCFMSWSMVELPLLECILGRSATRSCGAKSDSSLGSQTSTKTSSIKYLYMRPPIGCLSSRCSTTLGSRILKRSITSRSSRRQKRKSGKRLLNRLLKSHTRSHPLRS